MPTDERNVFGRSQSDGSLSDDKHRIQQKMLTVEQNVFGRSHSQKSPNKLPTISESEASVGEPAVSTACPADSTDGPSSVEPLAPSSSNDSTSSASTTKSVEEGSSSYPLGTWRPSLPKPAVELRAILEIDEILKAEVSSWPGELTRIKCAIRTMLNLVKVATHGCLVVMAPREYMDARDFQSYCSHVDNGYMTERLRKHKIGSPSFHNDFMEFVAHTSTDRWPSDYRDEKAQNQPKDGAIILDSTGQLLKAATRVTGLPLSAYSWPSYGTRHMTALQIASFLKSCVVAVRSDSGTFHLLAGNTHDESHVHCWCVADADSISSIQAAQPLNIFPSVESISSFQSAELRNRCPSEESVSSTQAAEQLDRFASIAIPELLPRRISDAGLVAKELEAHVSKWPGGANGAVREMLDLVTAANHACLVVMAPGFFMDMKNFQSNCSHVDNGYMTERLGKHKIGSPSFHDDFMEFIEHTCTDRWPSDYRDEKARNQPKDGAIILDSTGQLLKAAARVTGLPLSAYSWPSYGTRHMTALQIASFLKASVVAVRSDSGALHILACRGGGDHVDCWRVCGETDIDTAC